MNQTFGWCVIGCGKLAHIVAEQITASGRHRIVSAYSRREASAQEFVSRHGGTAYADALLCRGRFTPPRHESREIQ